MKKSIYIFLSILCIVQQTYCLEWAKKLWRKKTIEAPVEIPVPQVRKEYANMWDALKDGAPQEAQAIVDSAIDEFERKHATKIEIIFILQTNNNTQTNTTLVGPLDSTFAKSKQYLHSGTLQVSQGFNSLSEYIAQNKKMFIGIACISAYAAIQFILFSIKQKISQNVCWSLYESEDAQETSTQKLLNDIQHCYCNASNPADFITPLICFMEDTEEEKQYLEKYAQLLYFLEKLQFHRFFLYDELMYKSIQYRIERIDMLKRTFMAWLAEFKVNQVQNNSQQLLLGMHKIH